MVVTALVLSGCALAVAVVTLLWAVRDIRPVLRVRRLEILDDRDTVVVSAHAGEAGGALYLANAHGQILSETSANGRHGYIAVFNRHGHILSDMGRPPAAALGRSRKVPLKRSSVRRKTVLSDLSMDGE